MNQDLAPEHEIIFKKKTNSMSKRDSKKTQHAFVKKYGPGIHFIQFLHFEDLYKTNCVHREHSALG